jgi:hypothetical protein
MVLCFLYTLFLGRTLLFSGLWAVSLYLSLNTRRGSCGCVTGSAAACFFHL